MNKKERADTANEFHSVLSTLLLKRKWLWPSLETILGALVGLGAVPSIYRRGEVWRVHINAAGNFWAENVDLRSAFSEAYRAWMGASYQVDGDAVATTYASERDGRT